MSTASKSNFITVFSLFVLLVLWWFGLNFGVINNNSESRLFWSSSGQILLVVAVYCGYIFCVNRNKVDKDSKKIVSIFTLGALVQIIAIILFTYYSLKNNDESPYPTVADFFYGVISVCYVAVAFIVAKPFFKRLKFWAIFLPCWLIILAFSTLILIQFKFVLSWRIEPLADLHYIVLEGLASALGIAALIFSNAFKGYKYRTAYLFIVAAFFFQFFADSYFLNTNRVNLWVNGGSGDMLYLWAYFFAAGALLFFIDKVATVEMSILFLNSFLLVQLVLASKTNYFVSDLMIMLISVAVSTVLWRRNKSEINQRESAIRLQTLEQSNAKLLELDQQKTEFLNIAAHQLRTPVSIIRNYVSMMQDGDFGEVPEQIKEVHSHIYQSNQWLVRLADEFLNLSKLESGQLKYHLETADIAKAVDEVVAEIRPKAEQKGLILELIRPTEPVMARVDVEKIKHATMNLVENAVKYTLDGKITVTVQASTASTAETASTVSRAVSAVSAGSAVVAVSVIDTGIGVPLDDLPNLFQKFRRGKNAHEIEVNTSTGLGLYIARKFVEGHGGKVWGKSEGEGKGSEFGYTI